MSCNCGFVAKEDNDVISVDMCDGNVLETRAEVRVRSPQPLTDGVKIKQAKNGTKITVSLIRFANRLADSDVYICRFGVRVFVNVLREANELI